MDSQNTIINEQSDKETDVYALVLQLSHNYSCIIPRDDLRQYKRLDWGDNGIGDRWCGKKFNYSVIFVNRYKTYSENETDTVPADALTTFQTLNSTGKALSVSSFIHSAQM
jgi:hypothetical protein